MAPRSRTVVVSALNIAMHRPHSPERYVELFSSAYDTHKLYEQGEIHGLILGSLFGVRDAVQTNELSGEIYRFVKVDANEPWFNTLTRKQATEKEVQQISIPQNLLAHMQKIPFIFFPKEHELWYLSKDKTGSLSPGVVEKYLQTLFDHVVAEQQFPQVDVTTLPDKDALEEVFDVPGLHRVELTFKRPNPDDAGDLAAKFEQRLAGLNVQSRQEVLTSKKGERLQPDEQLRAEAEVAARNGRVTSVGVDEHGTPVEASTAKKPKRIPMRFIEAKETIRELIKRAKNL